MLSQNGVIHLYQVIINILNRDTTKYITKEKGNAFIVFKAKFKFFGRSSLGLGNIYTLES